MSSIPESEFLAQFLTALQSVVGEKAVLHEPSFAGNEIAYVTECISTGWVSSVGGYVDRLEADLAKYTGSYAVATVNGTSALHVALLLVGVQKDDEVIIPSLTFIATANAVAYCGATPHFVDVSSSSFGICPEALASYCERTFEKSNGHLRNKRTGKRLSAIVPMHTFGMPCDMLGLNEVARKLSVPVVEDAAESLGSFIGDQHTGTFGRVGILSFNGNKIITAGGGGAILTRDRNIAEQAKHLTTTAKQAHPWRYFHDQIGFNYRMPNLNAALACAQLENLPTLLHAKRQLANLYARTFANVSNVRMATERCGVTSNYWLNAAVLEGEAIAMRESILEATNKRGMMTRPCWEPLHTLPVYRACPAADLSNTLDLAGSILNLPSSACLWDRYETQQIG